MWLNDFLLLNFVLRVYSALGDAASSYIDVYNSTSNSWTGHPSGLGQARSYLAAASLPSGLVLFAGGLTGAPFPLAVMLLF